MNQTAPFWDFIASLESQGAEHPFFNSNNANNRGRDSDRDGNPSSDEDAPAWPWGWGFGFPSRRAWRHARRHGWYPGPPPAAAEPEADKKTEADNEKSGDKDGDEPAHYSDGAAAGGPGGRHRRGNGRQARRAAWPHSALWGMAPLMGNFLQSQFLGSQQQQTDSKGAQEFRPEVDVFDTETAFVVHASLPGAKKEDLAISWDGERSELVISGVTVRPGDEEFLRTLALDERRVGAFERKVRLGSRAQPAQVERDAISARLEDGVLMVKVPKADRDLVEVMKVDIE